MPKSLLNLNTVYISERLQESLRPVSLSALTTVVAPMGYGKTTAVNWYLEQCTKNKDIKIIRISVYSDNLEIFWKSIQNAFIHAGYDFVKDYICPNDMSGLWLLADDICHELNGDKGCYIFIDDFHLLTDGHVIDFLCILVNHLPANVHVIVASRDRFLPAKEIVRLGNKVYQIGIEHLRLNYTELGVYAHRSGIELDNEQIEALLYSSEGWFSAVYLNLRTLLESGVLPNQNSDIYTTFTSAMIEPLPLLLQEFLAVMGLADEFTVEMASFITEDHDAQKILRVLSEQNAFVKCLPDGLTYRFHHMMKECAKRRFNQMSDNQQAFYLERYGIWYENTKEYLYALMAYRNSKDYEGILRVIQKDAGIMLSSIDPKIVLKDTDECPKDILKAHPLAILVLMRRMFTWREIPKMMELKGLLLEAIDENHNLSEVERGNLLGECDLIMSFICYNDISAMSRLHRSASAQMSRLSISIQNSGGWTFDSPSVLMMFHRLAGELDSELKEMDECMPHYYKVTNNHGQGAENIMRAEATFMRGYFTDAYIELEQAYARVAGNGQMNMTLCADFLAWRLSLCADIQPQCSFKERYDELLSYHNSQWFKIWLTTSAYYHALKGEVDKIPEVFISHQLSTISFLAPGKPMIEMVENQVYLAEKAYAKIIGRSEKQLAICEMMHYALVALHIKIQTAIAFEMLGKSEEANKYLKEALNDASPDGLVMPFVENYEYLYPILIRQMQSPLISRITELGETVRKHRTLHKVPRVLNILTEREKEIVELMIKHLTNREIADELYLSEGTVKQYVNQIYAKLHIEGDTRTKRKELIKLIQSKT